MAQLLLPSGAHAPDDRIPFDREFFARHFPAEHAPVCELYSNGDIPVVELQLMNGETCDVFHFVALERDYLVAELFVDPPSCHAFYRSYVRYETIFRVNVRSYKPAERRLGFEPTAVEIPADEGAQRGS